MTSFSVTRQAQAEAGQFIRSLSSARQVYSLYPSSHPNRMAATHEALDAIRRLQKTLHADPVMFVARHALYLGPVLLPRDSLSRFGLVDALEKAGIEALELLPLITAGDVDKLVRVVLGELQADAVFEGIILNRVKPDFQLIEEDLGLTGLRRTYSMGLEVLRRTAAAVAADRPVDLDATTRVVRMLAEQVVHDPTQALMLATVRSHDEYTYYHMLNVCLLSIALGFAVGLTQDQILALGTGALLHDVGKVNVPLDILQHVGSLSEEQWRVIQRHPIEGAGILLSTGDGMTHPTASIVLEHHAAYDLSGYPTLSGRAHPSLPARMVAVADCFDAVTTTRPYRRAEERRQALNILLAGAGRGYDPRVVRTFVRLLGLFPIGSLVRLTDGTFGVVVRNHERILARPRVRIILDAKGNSCPPFEIDLTELGPNGEFRWDVERSMDPVELGVDMMSVVFAGQVEGPEDEGGEMEGGLLHDPAHGEEAPPGYIDPHSQAAQPA